MSKTQIWDTRYGGCVAVGLEIKKFLSLVGRTCNADQ